MAAVVDRRSATLAAKRMTDPSNASQQQDLDPRYIAARRVLLDALTVLAPHGDAVILAGAQAVYLHTGAADLAIAPYTTDGDLVLDPLLLGEAPELEAGMSAVEFHLQQQQPGGHVEPGIWLARASAAGEEILVPVDLIVPEGAASGTGKRAARLGGHGARAARRAVGLEAALVDNSTMTIAALDPADERSLQARVAGPAALLVAKAHKLHDRVASGRAARLDDKDASDVVRLMQTTRPDEIAVTLSALTQDAVAGPPTTTALTYLEELFGRRGRPGIEMASRALRTAIPEDRVQAICVAYVAALVP
jgi:hypothetical protein